MQVKFNELLKNGKKWIFTNSDTFKSNLKSIYSKLKLIKAGFDKNIDMSDINEDSNLRLGMDWYQPTKAILSIIYSRIQSVEILIFDNYKYYIHIKKITDEYDMKEKLKINYRHIKYSCVGAYIL